MEKIQTGEPLHIAEIITLTGRDALTTMGDYKVRIMNYSEGQLVDCDDIVDWCGYLWGIRKLEKPHDKYDSIAFRVVR